MPTTLAKIATAVASKSPIGLLINQQKSGNSVTCTGCQGTEMSWSWNFRLKRPVLLDKEGWPHECPTPQTRDVFPGWCDKCKAPDLVFLRNKQGLELTESYGLPHACEQDPALAIQDMSETSCKFCKTTSLFWVKVNGKYTLTHSDGTKHTCSFYTPYMKDWAEAKRMNYALEKKWLKSIPTNSFCKKCNATGRIAFLSKNKRTMAKFRSSEPITTYRPCKKCKCMGIFSVDKKKEYLKALRKKYWPFRGGVHKWKQYDGV